MEFGQSTRASRLIYEEGQISTYCSSAPSTIEPKGPMRQDRNSPGFDQPCSPHGPAASPGAQTTLGDIRNAGPEEH